MFAVILYRLDNCTGELDIQLPFNNDGFSGSMALLGRSVTGAGLHKGAGVVSLCCLTLSDQIRHIVPCCLCSSLLFIETVLYTVILAPIESYKRNVPFVDASSCRNVVSCRPSGACLLKCRLLIGPMS